MIYAFISYYSNYDQDGHFCLVKHNNVMYWQIVSPKCKDLVSFNFRVVRKLKCNSTIGWHLDYKECDLDSLS